MADRFFLINRDDREPVVELVNVGSFVEFRSLLAAVGHDRALASLAWGVVLDDDIPEDVLSVPPSDISFMLVKVMMRRLLHHVRPRRFDARGGHDRLRGYLRQTWEVQR